MRRAANGEVGGPSQCKAPVRTLPTAAGSISAARAGGRRHTPPQTRPRSPRPAPPHPRKGHWGAPLSLALSSQQPPRVPRGGCGGWTPARSPGRPSACPPACSPDSQRPAHLPTRQPPAQPRAPPTFSTRAPPAQKLPPHRRGRKRGLAGSRRRRRPLPPPRDPHNGIVGRPGRVAGRAATPCARSSRRGGRRRRRGDSRRGRGGGRRRRRHCSPPPAAPPPLPGRRGHRLARVRPNLRPHPPLVVQLVPPGGEEGEPPGAGNEKGHKGDAKLASVGGEGGPQPPGRREHGGQAGRWKGIRERGMGRFQIRKGGGGRGLGGRHGGQPRGEGSRWSAAGVGGEPGALGRGEGAGPSGARPMQLVGIHPDKYIVSRNYLSPGGWPGTGTVGRASAASQGWLAREVAPPPYRASRR